MSAPWLEVIVNGRNATDAPLITDSLVVQFGVPVDAPCATPLLEVMADADGVQDSLFGESLPKGEERSVEVSATSIMPEHPQRLPVQTKITVTATCGEISSSTHMELELLPGRDQRVLPRGLYFNTRNSVVFTGDHVASCGDGVLNVLENGVLRSFDGESGCQKAQPHLIGIDAQRFVLQTRDGAEIFQRDLDRLAVFPEAWFSSTTSSAFATVRQDTASFGYDIDIIDSNTFEILWSTEVSAANATFPVVLSANSTNLDVARIVADAPLSGTGRLEVLGLMATGQDPALLFTVEDAPMDAVVIPSSNTNVDLVLIARGAEGTRVSAHGVLGTTWSDTLEGSPERVITEPSFSGFVVVTDAEVALFHSGGKYGSIPIGDGVAATEVMASIRPGGSEAFVSWQEQSHWLSLDCDPVRIEMGVDAVYGMDQDLYFATTTLVQSTSHLSLVGADSLYRYVPNQCGSNSD